MTISAKTEVAGTAQEILNKFKKDFGQKVERGIRALAEHILGRSRELAPVDTTTLREDGHVRQEGYGLSTIVAVGYGTTGKSAWVWSQNENRMVVREPAEYAVYVHETHPPGLHNNFVKTGTWEYLAIPVRDLDTNRHVFNVAFASAAQG